LEGEPYTVGEGSQFQWFRSRILGGRTNHYGRMSFRFAEYDFTPYDRDGLGTNWPITYQDIAPYYDKAEDFIGVCGTTENVASCPDGKFHQAPPPKVHELLIKKSCDKLGIICIANRRAVITKPTNGRAPCHYCGQCGRGCKTASAYSSSQVQVFPAMKTGRVKLFTNAMARELITDASGKVTAVSYIDKTTRSEQQIRCRTVVVSTFPLSSYRSRHYCDIPGSSTDSTGCPDLWRLPMINRFGKRRPQLQKAPLEPSVRSYPAPTPSEMRRPASPTDSRHALLSHYRNLPYYPRDLP